MKYEIVKGSDKKGFFIRVRSLNKGKHFAVHRTYLKRGEDGKTITKNINSENCDLIIKSIKEKGITEGFIIIDNNEENFISPSDITHKLQQKEINFTSTGDKLDHHWPIFWKLKETNYSSIIRATMTLHQVCASRCQFCSTINRNRKDSITLDEAKKFVESLYYDQAKYNEENFSKYNSEYKKIHGSSIRLKGLILSGGGQPNLWPHFTEFVNWLSKLDIDLGLITNGFPKNIDDSIYDKFKWIRLSITPEDASPFYPDQKFNLQRIPKNILNSNSTFGLSYVYGPWTNDEFLNRLKETSKAWDVNYVRLLTDCNLGRTEQLKSHNNLSEKLQSIGVITDIGENKDKFFHQLKFHGTRIEAEELWDEGKCFLQTYNVFWDTTGHELNNKSYCYPCDSVTVLQEDNSQNDAERKFNPGKWGTVTNDQVERLYKEKWKKFFDTRENCSACLFMKNNRKVKELKSYNFEKNKISLKKNIEHINFP